MARSTASCVCEQYQTFASGGFALRGHRQGKFNETLIGGAAQRRVYESKCLLEITEQSEATEQPGLAEGLAHRG